MLNSGVVFIVLAIAAGVCATLQSATNGSLGKTMGVPAALAINTLVYVLVSLIYLAWVWRRSDVFLERWRDLHWVQFIGGICGFGIVLFLTLCFPRLGAAWTIVLMVLGQSISALIVDHVGWLGMPQMTMSVQRLFAMALIFVGVLILQK